MTRLQPPPQSRTPWSKFSYAIHICPKIGIEFESKTDGKVQFWQPNGLALRDRQRSTRV